MWYFGRDGRQEGPIADEQLRTMVSNGSLRREDLVWRDGMADWQPAGQIPGLPFPSPATYAPPPPPSAPASPYAPPRSEYVPPYVPPPLFGGAGFDIPNYLPWAIAATLLCCMPGGVASIVYAVKANSAKDRGDYVAADEAAKQAKTWLIISAALGLLVSAAAMVANLANLSNLK
jgi:Interferon-induced transmembrane protein/GYF domain 2